MFKRNEKEKFKNELIMKSSYRIGKLQNIILDYKKENEKYQIVLDKIKEKLEILNEKPYNATTYIMVITEIYKILEEIE